LHRTRRCLQEEFYIAGSEMSCVEFIGLPGAGKSHIRKNLLKVLKRRNKQGFIAAEEAFLEASKSSIDPVYRVILGSLPRNFGLRFCEKIINRSYMQYDAQNRFLAKWGRSFEIFLSSPVFDKVTMEDREIRISAFLNAGGIYECISNIGTGNKVTVFDELFLQKSFIFVSQLVGSSPEELGLYRYLENTPISDIVIHVKADINTCYERMLSRERGVIKLLRGSGKEDILGFLKRGEIHICSLIQWLGKRKDIVLLEISSENELDGAITKLADKMGAIHCA
jgi:hypothetical protein